MIFGSLLAIAHGTSLPIAMIIFGDMTDSFVTSGMTNITGKNMSCAENNDSYLENSWGKLSILTCFIDVSDTNLLTYHVVNS